MHRFSLKRVIVSAALALAALAILGVAWYFCDYYHALPESYASLVGDERISVEQRDDCILFEPVNPVAGLVFYPGAKVQAESYAPLMRKCAEHDILCVLVKMPLNFALLDRNAAERYVQRGSVNGQWYVGGHSLGGVAASGYAAEHARSVEGVVLLGAYSADDLSETALSVLSVYGSEDKVLNRDAYERNRGLLPAELTEIVITGANHAGFGCYGPQDGDGAATIPTSAQQEETAEALAGFCER